VLEIDRPVGRRTLKSSRDILRHDPCPIGQGMDMPVGPPLRHPSPRQIETYLVSHI